MTADGWTTVVRSRLGLGRLLPLGGPADGAWLAERAADAVLRGTAWRVPGVSPGRLRVGLADTEEGALPAPLVPPPPGALPPGPLRVEAEFAATSGDVPLPDLAARLRAALLAAAEDRLGLEVTEVDLRVTALLDTAPDAPEDGEVTPAGNGAPSADDPRETPLPGAASGSPLAAGPAAAADGAADPGDAVAGASDPADPGVADPAGVVAVGVPGVARLTSVLGPSVHRAADHVRIELATAPEHRALDVALAVRAAVGGALPVTVLVTGVGQSESPARSRSRLA
ncbi:hypothetical protein [Streptomyces sp. NPDC006368]|uniref:hypothetical protein n=1 Tax=Streptomyces sp. NPDC006368 TaxID=3156760 RepID=UPI0033B759F9